ncbi:FAD-dependent oxidoreductase [Chloroflexota bacterium]
MTVEPIKTDVLVIGGGLGGAFAAIKAKEAGIEKVTLVTKGKLGKDSVSTFAAGVWPGFFESDDREAAFKKRALSEVFAGGIYDEDWLNAFLDDCYDRMLDMENWGVEWEKTPDGEFERRKMRWEIHQAMFHGHHMMEQMARAVKRFGIQVIGNTMITDLLTERGMPEENVIGAVGIDIRTSEFKVFKAKATVIATGACALKSRFAKMVVGEGYAMAYRAGAKLGRFEIGEILQGGLREFDSVGWNMFVGLGGKWVNALGEECLLEYCPESGKFSPLARVAEASAMEVRAGRGPIYLDLSSYKPEDVRKLKVVIPLVTRIWESAGKISGDTIAKRIEWVNVNNGSIAEGGGVMTNTKAESSIPGLYACGDAMARPRHACCLPIAAVSAGRAGIFAAEYVKGVKEEVDIDERQVGELKKFALGPLERGDGIEPDQVILGVQETIVPYDVTVIARGDRLEKAIKEIERIRDEEVPMLYASDGHYLRVAHEAASMVLFAEMYLKSRLLREESRPGCAREDFPYTDNINWLKYTVLKQEEGKIKLWAEDVPVDKYKVKPKREKWLYKIFEVATKRGVKWG